MNMGTKHPLYLNYFWCRATRNIGRLWSSGSRRLGRTQMTGQ